MFFFKQFFLGFLQISFNLLFDIIHLLLRFIIDRLINLFDWCINFVLFSLANCNRSSVVFLSHILCRSNNLDSSGCVLFEVLLSISLFNNLLLFLSFLLLPFFLFFSLSLFCLEFLPLFSLPALLLFFLFLLFSLFLSLLFGLSLLFVFCLLLLLFSLLLLPFLLLLTLSGFHLHLSDTFLLLFFLFFLLLTLLLHIRCFLKVPSANNDGDLVQWLHS